VNGARPKEVVGWAGPWPADERWWEPESRRHARLQVLLGSEKDRQVALLLLRKNERWTVEGEYD
jgi:protein ImuB